MLELEEENKRLKTEIENLKKQISVRDNSENLFSDDSFFPENFPSKKINETGDAQEITDKNVSTSTPITKKLPKTFEILDKLE